MSTPQLAEYINSCYAQGMNDAQIQAALLQNGWTAAQLEGLFTASPPPPTSPILSTPTLSQPYATPSIVDTVLPSATSLPINTPARTSVMTDHLAQAALRPRRTWLKVSGLILALLLIGGGGLIAFAEQGYLPGVSRIYRNTPLPLLWHGTTANAGQAFAKMLLATSTNSTINTQTSLSFKLSKLDPSRSVSVDQLPFLAKLLPDTQKNNVASGFPSGPGRALLDTSSISSQSANPNYDAYLPLSLSLTTSLQLDDQRNAHGKADLDLTDIVTKLKTLLPDFIKQYPTLQNKISVEGSLLTNASQGFFRSNLIPYLVPADQNKWLAFSLPPEMVTALKHPDQSVDHLKLTPEDTAQIQAILKVIVTDQGIQRKDGLLYAGYHLDISPQSLKDLAKLSIFKDSKNDLSAVANSADFQVLGDLGMEPRTGRYLFYKGSIEVKIPSSNLLASIFIDQTTAYKLDRPIAPPLPSETVSEPGEQYLNQVWGKVATSNSSPNTSAPSLSSASDSQNLARQNTVQALSKLMEEYKKSGQNPPSTSGKSSRLDDPNNALSSAPGWDPDHNIPLPLSDPENSNLFYGYSSDGVTYTFSCAQTDSNGQLTAIYTVKDGGVVEVRQRQ